MAADIKAEVFVVADVAYLKSGGPKMTVVQIRDTMVLCQWFAVDGTVGSTWWGAELLTHTAPK